MTANADLTQLDTAVDLVMRASLARLSANAAEQAQELAQRADLTPAQLLAKTRDTYASVQTAAARMTGPAGTAHQLAVHAHNGRTARTNAAPSSGTLTALRERAAGLLDRLDPSADRPQPAGQPSRDTRLSLVSSLETIPGEVTVDAGPEP